MAVILVLGSGFAGYTAALELRRRLGSEHSITVISPAQRFVFLPALVWIPFGRRRESEISFEVAEPLREHDIRFLPRAVAAIHPHRRTVELEGGGQEGYDQLLIATGPSLDYDAVPGLGPWKGHTQSIYALFDAEKAAEAWDRLLADPGPVVIGGVPEAGYLPAAYEFALLAARELRERGLARRCPITFLTPEPFLGHWGQGGLGSVPEFLRGRFDELAIRAVREAAVTAISADEIALADGSRHRFRFAMLAPPFRGIAALRARPELADERGFVRVDATWRHPEYENIFAAGSAVALPPAPRTAVPLARPRSGYFADQSARAAAHNIAAVIRGRPPLALPPESIHARAVLDAGDTGALVAADSFLKPGRSAIVIPGPEAHWAKVLFERHFLRTRRRGAA